VIAGAKSLAQSKEVRHQVRKHNINNVAPGHLIIWRRVRTPNNQVISAMTVKERLRSECIFWGISPRGRRITNNAAYSAQTGFRSKAIKVAAAARIPPITIGENEEEYINQEAPAAADATKANVINHPRKAD
jgi:hypothetical protein